MNLPETRNSFISEANSAQRLAIEHGDGPLLIIAGPGSGKTFTLVERIVYLITQEGAMPESLLVVTFTEKAAAELTTRISNRLLGLGLRFNVNEMYLGTFHGICLRLLEDYRDFTRLKRNYAVWDQFEQHYFLYQNLEPYQALVGSEHILGDPQGARWRQAESLMDWLNKATEEALDVATLLAADDEAVVALGACLQVYRDQLETENALDFGAIQYEALCLLRGRPDVLDDIRGRLRYLMVDEYQDTNTIQEAILRLLCVDQPNLCVVGDDDQALYRFRGATVRNILTFGDLFPGHPCEQVQLTTNYRSHPDIVHFYNRWMGEQSWSLKGQTFRFEKKIVPDPDRTFPETAAVVRVAAPEDGEWANEVESFLVDIKGRGTVTDWNQIAFLFRSVKNPKVVALARELETRGFPIYSPRSNLFFEREEVRLVFGALIFLFPQFPKVRQWAENAHLPIWDYYDHQCFAPLIAELRKPENADLLKWARPLAKRHLTLTTNTDYTFSSLFYQLLRFPLFSRFLDEDEKGRLINERAARNLAQFSGLLVKYEYLHHVSVLSPDFLDQNLRSLFNSYLRFLHEGGIDEYEDAADYAPSGCLSFLTVHQSKGLEFPVVLVGSLEATPRKQYSDLDQVLEEGYFSRPPFEPIEHTKFFDFWRLFYTAFSRAQNLLVLTCAEKDGRGRTPSKWFNRFWEDLPDWRAPIFRPDLLKLAEIRPTNLKREYAFTSDLTVFENCAQQYRWFKWLAFTPVRTSGILFGTLVHQTIEDIHKAVLRGETERVTDDQIGNWFESNYRYLTQRERVYLAEYVKNVALEQVRRYVRRQNGDWSRIVAAEVDISLVKDEYILTGTVDLVTGEDEHTVEIFDFKAEKKPDLVRDREKLRRYQRQLEVYAHLVEERTAKRVARTHLYYTSEESGNPLITFQKDTKAIAATIGIFDAVVGRIERQDFRLSERPDKLCKDCDMRAHCDAKNWRFSNT
jgi:DNA helicase-2/ATP-dependent DNA helicase PcrA